MDFDVVIKEEPIQAHVTDLSIDKLKKNIEWKKEMFEECKSELFSDCIEVCNLILSFADGEMGYEEAMDKCLKVKPLLVGHNITIASLIVQFEEYKR